MCGQDEPDILAHVSASILAAARGGVGWGEGGHLSREGSRWCFEGSLPASHDEHVEAEEAPSSAENLPANRLVPS